jgi:hypothetical protein
MDTLKQKLLNEVYKVINSNNAGTHNFKINRRNFLKRLVKDILDLKLDIKTFSSFNSEHFNTLISRWKTKGNSNSTIINKIGMLKWFLNRLGLTITLPETSDLDLTRKDLFIPSPQIPEDLRHNIFHPICRTILDFQLFFGLTKNESIHLNLDTSLIGKELHISSRLAFNSNERFIFATSANQKEAIEYRYEVLKEHSLLLSLLQAPKIKELYEIELEYNNISKATNLRKYFIQKRFIQYQNKGISLQENYNLLMQETGYKTTRQLEKLVY